MAPLSGTVSLKLPSASVCVPLLDPFNITVTPLSGMSVSSFTLPFICLPWAKSETLHTTRKNKEKKYFILVCLGLRIDFSNPAEMCRDERIKNTYTDFLNR
jgi:hypothetical protein